MKAMVTVVATDRIGIIADVCTMLAEMRINILDISQTVMENYLAMTMLVDTSASPLPFGEISETVKKKGEEFGLVIHIQHEDIFNAMHKI